VGAPAAVPCRQPSVYRASSSSALAPPEDPDQEGGQQRARDRDEQEEGPRIAHGEELPGDQDAAPGAEVADAVAPAGAQRPHLGRVVGRDYTYMLHSHKIMTPDPGPIGAGQQERLRSNAGV
jgi:hypothetical protein